MFSSQQALTSSLTSIAPSKLAPWQWQYVEGQRGSWRMAGVEGAVTQATQRCRLPCAFVCMPPSSCLVVSDTLLAAWRPGMHWAYSCARPLASSSIALLVASGAPLSCPLLAAALLASWPQLFCLLHGQALRRLRRCATRALMYLVMIVSLSSCLATPGVALALYAMYFVPLFLCLCLCHSCLACA